MTCARIRFFEISLLGAIAAVLSFFSFVPTAFAADKVIFLFESSTSWTVPSDWNSSVNTIEAIGAGGSGSSASDGFGGGGGGYGKIINFSASPGASITVQIPGATSGGISGPGAAGGDTCFSDCSVLKGGGGGAGTGSAAGAGGVGVGDVTYTGGTGGPTASSPSGSGGGGAAGPNGNGASGSGDTGNGGAGDNGNGGAGGIGFTGAAGGTAVQWTRTEGSALTAGAGGGGGAGDLGVNGGDGGRFGGGGGGGSGFGGSGAEGIIVITYTPAVAPTVTVQAASSIGATGVTGNGSITATGGATVTSRGFVYGTTSAYGATTTDSGSYSTGVFTYSITGLSCATTYNYKSYATNAIGTGYSANATFTTEACPGSSSASGGAVLPWCSGPFAPGWRAGLPGGGCGTVVSVVTYSRPVILSNQKKLCPHYFFLVNLDWGIPGRMCGNFNDSSTVVAFHLV